jgi:hypothetical protein
MPDTEKILSHITSVIAQGSPLAIEAALAQLEELDEPMAVEPTRMKILNRLLMAAQKRGCDIDSLQYVLAKFLSEEDPDMDILILQMCLWACFTENTIAYVINQYGDISPEEILTLLIEQGGKYTFPLAVRRLRTVFKLVNEDQRLEDFLSSDQWETLSRIATSAERPDIVAHIKLENPPPPAAKPEYMTLAPKLIRGHKSDLEKQARAKKLTQTLFTAADPVLPAMGETIAGVIDKFMGQLSPAECDVIINQYDHSEEEWIEDPDMLEGPPNGYANPQTQHCVGAPDFRAIGQCHMLTCGCRNDDEDAEYYDPVRLEWFTGKCEHCQIRIVKACYALRLPCDAGGWIGCFCSAECALVTANNEIQAGLNPKEKYTKFNQMMAAIQYKKIVDREDLYATEEETIGAPPNSSS